MRRKSAFAIFHLYFAQYCITGLTNDATASNVDRTLVAGVLVSAIPGATVYAITRYNNAHTHALIPLIS